MLKDNELAALEAEQTVLWKAYKEAEDERDRRLNRWLAVHAAVTKEQNKRQLLRELAEETKAV